MATRTLARDALICFALLSTFSNVLVLGQQIDAFVVNDEQLAKDWLSASYDFDKIAYHQKDSVINFLGGLVTNQTTSFKLSDQCRSSLSTLRDGLDKRRLWAYKFIDASASGHSGLAHGYISDLGDHGECLSINVKGKEPFRGQYCLASLKFPAAKKLERNWLVQHRLNLTGVGLNGTIYEHFGNHSELFNHEFITFALCVPSTCSRDEINDIVQDAMKGKKLVGELKPTCQVEQETMEIVFNQPFYRIACLFFVIMVFMLVSFSTMITALCGEATPLRHFSAVRNAIKVATNYRDPYMKKIMFMDTLKFWYHTSSLLAHCFAFAFSLVPVISGVMFNIDEFIDNNWLLTEWLKKAIYMPQIMFMLSGIFASYFMLPVIKKANGKIPFSSYVLKRYLRTTPTTIGVIALMVGISCFLNGPIADELLDKHMGNCRDNWWKTVLNINNYDVLADICIPVSWSQSVDFHLWILAYFPLMWLHTKPKLGIYVCFALIGVGMAAPAAVMLYYDLPSTTSGRPIDMLYYMMHGNYFPRMHLGTHNNISSYFIGILVGYCFANNLKPQTMKFITMILMIVVCTAISYGSILAPYILTNIIGFPYIRFFDVLYGATIRVTFVAMFAAIYYFTYFSVDKMTKYIPFATKFFLMSPVYVPFGRISYTVYLSQLIPMAIYFTQSYEYLPIDLYYMVFRFLSLVFVCWVFGFLVFLLFEAPFISITKSVLVKQLAAETIKTNERGDANGNMELPSRNTRNDQNV